MEQTQIGIVSPAPMNDWNDKAAYYLLNIVRHNGAVYIARSASEGIEPGVTTGWDMYWLMLVKDGVSPQIQIDAVPTKDSPNPVSSGGTFDALDGKLDKITTASSNSKVYGIEKDGSQTSFIVATGTTVGGLPMWDRNGALKTNAPVNNADCANKKYVDAIKPIEGGTVDPDGTIDAKFLGRLYMNEATGEMFYAAQNISTGSYEWRSIISKAKKQSTVPTGEQAGYVGQLCLVGSSDSSPYEVYICVMSNPESNTYVWHKMCTTEAPT